MHPTLDLVVEVTGCNPADATSLSLRPLQPGPDDHEQAWSLELSSPHDTDVAQIVYSLQQPPEVEYGINYTLFNKATNTVVDVSQVSRRVCGTGIESIAAVTDDLHADVVQSLRANVSPTTYGCFVVDQ